MPLTKSAIRGAGWAVAGGYVSQLLAFAMFIVVSRIVGPAAFGAVAVAIAMVELCRALVSENVAANLTAQPVFDRQAFNAGFVWSMTGAVVIYGGLCLAAPLFASLFRTPALTFVLPQIALLLLFHAASRMQEARLVQEMRFRSLAARAVAAALVGGAVGIGAAYAGYGVNALIWQQWASGLVSLVLLWTACAWRPSLDFSRAAFDKLNRESLALAPANLITNLSGLVDGLAVAAFSGPAAAGVYNLGKRVRLAMQIALSSALDRVSLPAFARANAMEEKDKLAVTLEQVMRVSMVVAFPLFFGLAAVAPDLIELCLGAQWAAAATPTTLLLIAGALGIAANYCENALLVLDQRRWIIALRGLLLVLLCIALVLVGSFGPDAIAAAALVASVGHLAAGLYAASHFARVPLRTLVSALIRPLAIGLAMLLLLLMLRTLDLHTLPVWARLALQITVGVLFYVSAIWLFARSTVRAMVQAARTAL